MKEIKAKPALKKFIKLAQKAIENTYSTKDIFVKGFYGKIENSKELLEKLRTAFPRHTTAYVIHSSGLFMGNFMVAVEIYEEKSKDFVKDDEYITYKIKGGSYISIELPLSELPTKRLPFDNYVEQHFFRDSKPVVNILIFL